MRQWENVVLLHDIRSILRVWTLFYTSLSFQMVQSTSHLQMKL